MAHDHSSCDDLIVVIHGFGGKRVFMLPLCWRLRRSGFRVANWGYFSIFSSVDQHAARLRNFLTQSLCKERRFHIVAHSMGAIIVRAALSKGQIPNLQRVVLLAPPNSGSPRARWASAIAGRLCKPLTDLSDGDCSYLTTLASIDAEFAVIAARFDILVPVGNTHLTGERQHVVLNATHNSLLVSRAAAAMSSRFLTSGKLD